MIAPVLISGKWRAAQSGRTFRAENPATGEILPEEFPVSSWADCDEALDAAAGAAAVLRALPPSQIAAFLLRFASRIEARASELVETAHRETGLPKKPRLADVELVRTVDQLRQAAAATVEGSWALPTIDTKANIRSCLAPLGPVWVFGPNNFPFAYNGAAGGDFAAAIAVGNPVIAKANPSHPATTLRLAQEARTALDEAGLPPSSVQLLFHMDYKDGERLAADPRTGALAFTGSRAGGLKLKAAADAAGKPVYLELSSINPVVILPGALDERALKIAEELAGSCLLASGQFCTSPGLVILPAGESAESFILAMKTRLEAAPVAPLLSSGVARGLAFAVETLRGCGAELVTGGSPAPGQGHRFANTLLRVSGSRFLAEPERLQTEAFGNASMIVVARDLAEIRKIVGCLEGNLTGCVYSHTGGDDDTAYVEIEPELRRRVGRLLNDKVPTGVAVSPAMNHGGPYPATGHPGFTAVGFPACMRRFAMLQCYDNVRPERLPASLGNKNPNGRMWRLVDRELTRGDA